MSLSCSTSAPCKSFCGQPLFKSAQCHEAFAAIGGALFT